MITLIPIIPRESLIHLPILKNCLRVFLFRRNSKNDIIFDTIFSKKTFFSPRVSPSNNKCTIHWNVSPAKIVNQSNNRDHVVRLYISEDQDVELRRRHLTDK